MDIPRGNTVSNSLIMCPSTLHGNTSIVLRSSIGYNSTLKNHNMKLLLHNNKEYKIPDFTEEEVFKVIGKRKCVNRTLFCSEENKKAYLVPTSTFYMSEEQGLTLDEMWDKYPMKITNV